MFVPGHLLVKFIPTIKTEDKQNIHSKIGATLLEEIPMYNIDLVKIPEGQEENYRKVYIRFKEVVHVEFNDLFSTSYRPNDPFYLTPTQTSSGLQSQWGLRRVNPEPAWDVTRNIQQRARIAILDTGIDPTHPDLASKIIFPANFVDGIPNAGDIDGHGTHVAGIAAAVTDNATGIAGMSFNSVSIIPIRVLGGPAGGQIFRILQGIAWAVTNGANVINMSLRQIPPNAGYNQFLQDAINDAWNRGIVIVASAGNDNTDVVQYPAGYNHVLAVSATDQNNNKATFSNFGVDVGITAPGVDILSTVPTYSTPGHLTNYDTISGTSQATPFVSGLAAMLFAAFPQLSNIEVVRIIQSSARSLGTNGLKQWSPIFGYGLLDAGNAFRLALEFISSENDNSDEWESSSFSSGSSGRKSSKRNRALGSFYGQVIQNNPAHTPVAGTTVRAISIQTGQVVREFVTQANGMFRLMNLPTGSYIVQAQLGPSITQQAVNIVPGADVYLQLIQF